MANADNDNIISEIDCYGYDHNDDSVEDYVKQDEDDDKDGDESFMVVVVVAFPSRARRTFGKMFDNSVPACVFFLFFFKWRLARAN